MQRDLHLIYNQIPVIWIKAGKPPLDTQKVREKKEQLKIPQGHNLAPNTKHSFIIPKWNSVDIMPPIVWKKVPGSARKWELVYAKKIKEIIWGWGKRIGHTALSPSTFWHLPFPEIQATAEPSGEEMAINPHPGALPHKFQLFSAAAFQPISPPITQLCSEARGARQKEGQEPQQPPEPPAGSSARAELCSQTRRHPPSAPTAKGCFN